MSKKGAVTFEESNMFMQKHEMDSIARKNRVVNNIIDALADRNGFLILGHENPDEDCIASMVAVGLLLSKMQKRVMICTATEIPVHFRYLLEICRFNSILVNTGCRGIDETIDTVIICDTPKPAMIEAPPAIRQILARRDILKIEIDHHLDSDSKYAGNDEYCLVAAASSASELVGYLGCKLSARDDIVNRFDIKDVFSRNVVLTILTGIVGDTQMGRFIKSKRERRFYQVFSAMFNRLLAEKTTKHTNFNNMEQVYTELRSLSASQEELYDELLQRRNCSPSICYTVLDEADSQKTYSRFELDTVIAVARTIADELAESSGKLSMVAYYDHANSSNLVQFRMRRSRSFHDLDLRELLPVLEIENGGGHEGAIGFRIPKSQVESFPDLIQRILDRTEQTIANGK